ncbi:GMP synthase - Glutamine amidotransferase domain [Geoglobus ahangari]|uniref:GMP synthase-Glutamine amidotransferase domain n=1 Tax=Geoglobus ahangari TaxID=113653 RepID=A0A0F7IDK4_9EURY|nr:type 1 glutamine amidotransferase [Geoglobus ahangari]AKG91533.1 GMP synthase - Glutamine amidotransferase domain [Geoglobus ahangari]
MKILAIKNHRAEGLGYIEELFAQKGVEYEYVEAWNGERKEDGDAYIILGGPMGVYEAEKYPFLKWEMELIRREAERKPILGICLGAQLIAGAFGKRVYPFKKEIGWFYVNRVDDDPLFDGFPERIEVFQWHGDTFDLPDGARLIFTGDEVRNQGFRAGEAVGIQFHLEMTLELIEKWVKTTEGVPESIIDESADKIEEHNRLCEIMVDNFIREVEQKHNL